MMLETSRFGAIAVADEDIFTVANGIPGFPDLRRVVLFAGAGAGGDADNHPDSRTDDSPTPGSVLSSVFWIQDVDNGELSFMSMSPWDAFPDYEIEFDEAELGITDASDVRVLALVSIHRQDGAAHLVANLRAPLIVDVTRRTLAQVILTDPTWPIRVPFALLGEAGGR